MWHHVYLWVAFIHVCCVLFTTSAFHLIPYILTCEIKLKRMDYFACLYCMLWCDSKDWHGLKWYWDSCWQFLITSSLPKLIAKHNPELESKGTRTFLECTIWTGDLSSDWHLPRCCSSSLITCVGKRQLIQCDQKEGAYFQHVIVTSTVGQYMLYLYVYWYRGHARHSYKRLQPSRPSVEWETAQQAATDNWTCHWWPNQPSTNDPCTGTLHGYCRTNEHWPPFREWINCC